MTDRNEEQQLRLGLGQVLRYRNLLAERFGTVTAVLAVERVPSDRTWMHLCRQLDVLLVRPGNMNALQERNGWPSATGMAARQEATSQNTDQGDGMNCRRPYVGVSRTTSAPLQRSITLLDRAGPGQENASRLAGRAGDPAGHYRRLTALNRTNSRHLRPQEHRSDASSEKIGSSAVEPGNYSPAGIERLFKWRFFSRNAESSVDSLHWATQYDVSLL